MNLTNLEQKVVLVSLDHMEEHLFIVYEAGDMTEDTCTLEDGETYEMLGNDLITKTKI